MHKRRVALAAAIALIASLAFATPTQAGSVLQTTASFATASPALTDLNITFAGTGVIDPTVTIVSQSPGPPPVVTGSVSGFTVDLHIVPASPGPLSVTFDITTATSSGATISGVSWTPSASSVTGLSVGPPVYLAIPEPASLSLLGIGMTGFFTFRRLFKRTRAA
jgi:hypothetical protein